MPCIAAPSGQCKNPGGSDSKAEGGVDEATSGPGSPAETRPERRLDSWKKIAAYLKRDVSTVQRWERREGMPVHRHLHDKLGSVYAFPSEIDAWWESRSLGLASEEKDAGTSATPGAIPSTVLPTAGAHPSAAPSTAAPPARRSVFIRIAAALGALLVGVLWLVERTDYFWRSPLTSAHFTPLTDFEGIEQAAAISRKGTFVAFVADRDGRMDAWVTRVGSGDFLNLTHGGAGELVNPSIRTVGFSPDESQVSVWVRAADGSNPDDISVRRVPTSGGALRPFLAAAAEVDWSSDGKRLVYHTTAPGDPIFVKGTEEATARQVFIAPAGVHCHFPVWSPDDEFIYFVKGVPPDEWDVWRIRPSGGDPEQITSHNTRVTYPVLLDRRTLLYLATDRDGSGPWLYALDVEKRIPHRISQGIETYTSLAASADARHLVLTAADSRASLWRVPLSEQPNEQSAPTRLALETGRGRSPRLGRDYVLYVSRREGREGIWKLADGKTSELWSARGARVVGAPAIAPDGRRITFVASEEGRPRLYVMNDDGTNTRTLSESLELRGSPSWSPDGESIVVAANHEGGPKLFRIAAGGSASALLVSEYSIDPVWSPDGRFLVYSGADVGTTLPLRAARADGRVYPLPGLVLGRGARRVAFMPGRDALVVLRGELEHKDFYLVDLETGSERQLTHLGRDFVIHDFDVAADGSAILFDDVQQSSDIVLVDLP
jgi:Tol biopolymer transport system component